MEVQFLSDREVKAVSARFPFLMLLTANFIVGFAFVVLFIPILNLIMMPTNVSTLGEYFFQQEIVFWMSLLKVDVAPLIFMLLTSIPIGVTIQTPMFLIRQLLLPIVLWIVKFVKQLIGQEIPSEIQHAQTLITGSDYPSFLNWLMQNPADRMQWEWELFWDNLAWGLTTDIVLFTGLNLWAAQWKGLTISLHFKTAMIIVLFASLVFAIGHSWVFVITDGMLRKKAESEQTVQQVESKVSLNKKLILNPTVIPITIPHN